MALAGAEGQPDGWKPPRICIAVGPPLPFPLSLERVRLTQSTQVCQGSISQLATALGLVGPGAGRRDAPWPAICDEAPRLVAISYPDERCGDRTVTCVHVGSGGARTTAVRRACSLRTGSGV